MLKSFRSQLIALFLSLLTVMAFTIGFATLNAMKKESDAQALRALGVASNVFQEALNNRAYQLSSSVRIVASDFGFRQAVALKEQDTISTVLENYGSRIDADLSFLLSPEGMLLASTAQQLDATQVSTLNQDIANSTTEGFTDIIYLGQQAYQIVIVPVKAPQLIAWVGMGFALDQKLAEQIKGITELDISFVLAKQSPLLFASTLTPMPSDPILQNQATPWLVLHQQQALLTASETLDKHGKIKALLHLPMTKWQESYRDARAQLIFIFGVGLTLALFFAVILARNIAKPVNRLSEFAQKIGLGQQVLLPEVAQAEFNTLAITLKKMQEDIESRERKILYQSEHDTLTGLANRTLVERELPVILSQQDVQLLMININGFKLVNDAFGYSNGDLLLQQLAERLRSPNLLPSQLTSILTARLGGDEFLMVLSGGLTNTDLAELQSKLSQGFQLANSFLNLKVALATVYCTANAMNAEHALRRVDIAMVHAKTTNNLIGIYQQGQDESHQRELTLLHDLPHSLKSGHMFVVYQPKVAIQQPRARSAEALIRWQHPTLGFIPPDEFIRLAEHSGLISQVTDWMIEQVIQQLAAWHLAGFDLTVAINLSAHDLLNAELPSQLQQLLTKYQLASSALALEVTEGAVMQDPQQVIQNLQALRNMGIDLAIDDFGTGQSSLAYLKQLPVHEVKIDRAFVKDIENNANDQLIVQATTQLAHGLGLRVTAEGLENSAGLQQLLHAGVDKVQGYYFSRPLPAAAFIQWMQNFPLQQHTWFTES